MKQKKKNPQITLKQTEFERIRKDYTDNGVNGAFAIFLTVMRDKWGFGHKRLNRLYNQIIELSEIIGEGYVSVDNLKEILRNEMGINIKGYKDRLQAKN